MDDVDESIRKLINILNTFKKSPNRKYTKQTLINKAEESRDLYLELLEKLEFHSNGKFILAGVRNTYTRLLLAFV